LLLDQNMIGKGVVGTNFLHSYTNLMIGVQDSLEDINKNIFLVNDEKLVPIYNILGIFDVISI